MRHTWLYPIKYTSRDSLICGQWFGTEGALNNKKVDKYNKKNMKKWLIMKQNELYRKGIIRDECSNGDEEAWIGSENSVLHTYRTSWSSNIGFWKTRICKLKMKNRTKIQSDNACGLIIEAKVKGYRTHFNVNEGLELGNDEKDRKWMISDTSTPLKEFLPFHWTWWWSTVVESWNMGTWLTMLSNYTIHINSTIWGNIRS